MNIKRQAAAAKSHPHSDQPAREAFMKIIFSGAHEINNPREIIHARASDLKEEAAKSATMEKIRNTASRVTKITMGLQKFARKTRNDPATETGVREILEDTLAFCMERLKHKSVELRMQAVDSALRIDCKPTEISQVLLNLLSNAVHAVQELPEKWNCR